MKLQLISVVGICVISFMSNMNLGAHLLEQTLSSELTVWEVNGRTCEQHAQANVYTVLNLQYPDVRSMRVTEWVNAIAGLNADMVCIQGLATAEIARSTCEALQDNYAHFLYLDPFMSERQPADTLGKLLIASKYSFSAADPNSMIIKALEFIMGTYFCQETAQALVLGFLPEERGPDYTVSTHIVRILSQSEGLLVHIVNNRACLLPDSSDTLSTHQTSQSLQMQYYNPGQELILVRRGGEDRDAGVSLRGTLDVTLGGPDGVRWSAGIEGQVHDDSGNSVEGGVKYNSKTGETHIGISGGREESRRENRGTRDGPNDK